ncbi:hypothetical protein JCM16303_004688 [Sporobolomyces ruberrimus]
MSAAGPPYDSPDKAKREMDGLWAEFDLLKSPLDNDKQFALLNHMMHILGNTPEDNYSTKSFGDREEVQYHEFVPHTGRFFHHYPHGFEEYDPLTRTKILYTPPPLGLEIFQVLTSCSTVRARDGSWDAYIRELDPEKRATKLSEFVTAAVVAEEFGHPPETRYIWFYSKYLYFYKYMPGSTKWFRRGDTGAIQEWHPDPTTARSIGHRVARIHGTTKVAWQAQARRRYR